MTIPWFHYFWVSLRMVWLRNGLGWAKGSGLQIREGIRRDEVRWLRDEGIHWSNRLTWLGWKFSGWRLMSGFFSGCSPPSEDARPDGRFLPEVSATETTKFDPKPGFGLRRRSPRY